MPSLLPHGLSAKAICFSLYAMRNHTIPLFFWLIVPILLILAQIGLELSFTREQLGPLHSENGPDRRSGVRLHTRGLAARATAVQALESDR